MDPREVPKTYLPPKKAVLARPPGPRIAGFDLARGLAVFGMALVNFKFVMGADEAGPAWLVRLAGLFDGRAAAVFVALAGVGLTLLSRRARESGDPAELASVRKSLYKRSAFLFLAGLLCLPVWPGDILHYYGLYLAVGTLLVAAPGRLLWALSAAVAAAFVGLILVLDYEKGWDAGTFSYAGFWTAPGFLRNLLFNGAHPVFPWIAFLFLGVWLGRQDLSRLDLRRRLFLAGAGAAVLAEAASRALIAWALRGPTRFDSETVAALLGTEPMPPMPLYLVSGGGTAVAVIALSLQLAERWPEAAWVRAVAAVGQMSLTLYAAHVVLGIGLFRLLGLIEGQSLWFAAACALVFCAGALAFAVLWRRRHERGPLERAMRRLSG